MSDVTKIASQDVRLWLSDGDEIALIDVREAGEFAAGHPLFASSLPFGQLEARLMELVPALNCRLVFIDDGFTGRAKRAGRIAQALGYSKVFELDGGTAAWARAGFTLFEGVFVPSKAFGELAEEAFAVPHISASQLHSWQTLNKPVVILDGRPFDEHRRMNIPGSLCLPNGDLPYRADQVITDSETPIVVHCAGRTRSIVGAQILRDLGLPNPIYALENGTQGWVLAGFELERGSARLVDGPPTEDHLAVMRAEARERAGQWQVPLIDAAQLCRWTEDAGRATYCLDIRSAAEFNAGHIDGFVHAPGGQLIQSTDQWAAVRGAHIVLADDTGLRAVVVARWLRMMGWDCHVLMEGPETWASIRIVRLPAPARALPMKASLPLPAGARLIDARRSTEHRRSHPAGAQWMLRWQLERTVSDWERERPVIVIADDQDILGAFAGDLADLGFAYVASLSGEPEAWRAAGLATRSSPNSPTDAEALDFVFFTHDRHSGNLDAARKYLAWETGLVGQLSPDERAMFVVPEVSAQHGQHAALRAGGTLRKPI